VGLRDDSASNNSLPLNFNAMAIGGSSSDEHDNLRRPPQQKRQQQPAPSVIIENAGAVSGATAKVSNFNSSSNNNSNNGTTNNYIIQERRHFVIFVKILFKILDDAKHEPQTKAMAKRIVLDCRRRNAMGDPMYVPLMDAIEVRLKRVVGKATWTKAHILLHHYITTIQRDNRTNTSMDDLDGIQILVLVGKQS
jgi:hypothetical protein